MPKTRAIAAGTASAAARAGGIFGPAAVRFQTKAEIALALLDEANACGVQHRCVTCVADYGDNPHFLNPKNSVGHQN
jgi:SRSO17 transposase